MTVRAFRFLGQFALVLAFVLPATASCSNATETTKRISPYIVQIAVADNITNGEALNVTPIGNGFFVNPDGWLVTAKQVIDLATEEIRRRGAGASIAVFVPGDPTTGMGFSSNSNPLAVLVNELEFEASPRVYNVALLKVKSDLGPNPGNGAVHPVINYGTHLSGTLDFGPVPLLRRELKPGDAVAVSGYPSNGFALTTSSGRMTSAALASSHPTDITSSVVLAGAPVYLPGNAAIVGMAVNVPGEANIAVIPAGDIVEFLDNYGIEWRR